MILLIGSGFWLGRQRSVDVGSLSPVSMYLFTPALIFESLVKYRATEGDGARIFLYATVHVVLLLGLSLAIAWATRQRRQAAAGFILSVIMMNSGNYGLALNLFAFGAEGFRLAMFVFLTSATIGIGLAAVVAAWAGGGDFRRAVRDVVRLPIVYAAITGAVVSTLGWTVPEVISRPVSVLAAGSIPLLLVTLGVQLSRAKAMQLEPDLGIALAMRLLLSPLLAFALAPAFGLSGMARNVAIVQTAMPTAVNAFLYAAEFNCRPGFVATAVFTSTILSFLTLTVLLALL
ncbi:MAG: AEC family transporter [Armatimonadetes bacterium]|nr:AEC family transporter [Armatimonadota bacterium]